LLEQVNKEFLTVRRVRSRGAAEYHNEMKSPFLELSRTMPNHEVVRYIEDLMTRPR
jgi:hypothetical protein